MSTFTKYERRGAYHWQQTARSFTNQAFNAPLRGRYDVVMHFVPRRVNTILDVGCGDGYLLSRLAPRAQGMLAGIDDNMLALELARKELAVRMPTRSIVLQQASVCQLPFVDNSFSVVVCADVIEHLQDPVAAIREMARVLVPGGRVIISTPHARSGYCWDACHVKEYSAGEVHEMINGVYGNSEVFGAWPLAIFDLWKQHKRIRPWINFLAICGLNVFSLVSRHALSCYGQLIVIASKKENQ